MEFNVQTARDYAERSQIQEWVLLYLRLSPKPNPKLHDVIARHRPLWKGPMEYELALLTRIAGPDTEGLGWTEPLAKWTEKVEGIAASITDPAQLPPLIVREEAGKLRIPDGNHRHAAMIANGWKTGWVLLWCDRDESLQGQW